MARPQDKASLLEQAQVNYDKLQQLIAQFSPEQQAGTFPFEDRDRNLRDVLIHLYEWHQLLLNWVTANRVAETVTPFLPKPYNWKNYGEMNVGFWQQHQKTPLSDAKQMLAQSHQEVIQLITGFTDEELFTKKYFSWTGTTSLGSYCVSATASHYDWAMKKLKRYLKALKTS